jgi:hypothetical protein
MDSQWYYDVIIKSRLINSKHILMIISEIKCEPKPK